MMNLKVREEKYSGGIKCFSIPYETWYAETAVKPFEKESIIIGFYDEQGGAAGEFRLEWNEHGIQLKAFDDSWGALSRMPELLQLMDQLDIEKKETTVKEFAEMLRLLGYKDITKRDKRDDGSQVLKIEGNKRETVKKRC